MLEKLHLLRAEHAELQARMSDPSVYGNPAELAKVGKRIAQLGPIVETAQQLESARKALQEAEVLSADPELGPMAQEEAALLRDACAGLEVKLQDLLLPRDPNDDKNVIVEIRAGTGGEEAALFAAQLLRMYLRYCEERGWKHSLISAQHADGGGVKEVVVKIEGNETYGHLKFESGVHRVQRVPETEAKGRVHTSAATVAVLPEAEDADITIRNEDLRIDTYRASGAGGQHVNKTESAVRITHMPTGVVVACQTERSQMQNRELAMQLLRSRLYEAEQERLAKERGEMRSMQVGSGDRSEKIRTYNFPQDRCTDHRIGQNFSNLPAIMDGHLDDIVQALREQERLERLARATS